MRCGTYVWKPTRCCSPSLPISMPAADCFSTTWRTARSISRASSAGSMGPPSSRRMRNSESVSLRGRLPTWVVRIRSRLRTILLQLHHDSVLGAFDQQLGVGAVAAIEAHVAEGVVIHRNLLIGSGGLQRAIFEVDHHNVLVVEMHGGGAAGEPSVIPDDDAVVFEHLLHTGPREGVGKARGVGERRDGMILEADYDGASAGIFRRGSSFGENDIAGVVLRAGREIDGDRVAGGGGLVLAGGDVPDGDTFVIDDGLGRGGGEKNKACGKKRESELHGGGFILLQGRRGTLPYGRGSAGTMTTCGWNWHSGRQGSRRNYRKDSNTRCWRRARRGRWRIGKRRWTGHWTSRSVRRH